MFGRENHLWEVSPCFTLLSFLWRKQFRNKISDSKGTNGFREPMYRCNSLALACRASTYSCHCFFFFCRFIFAVVRTLFVCCSFLVVLAWPWHKLLNQYEAIEDINAACKCKFLGPSFRGRSENGNTFHQCIQTVMSTEFPREKGAEEKKLFKNGRHLFWAAPTLCMLYADSVLLSRCACHCRVHMPQHFSWFWLLHLHGSFLVSIENVRRWRVKTSFVLQRSRWRIQHMRSTMLSCSGT